MRYGEEYRCQLPHGKIWIEDKEELYICDHADNLCNCLNQLDKSSPALFSGLKITCGLKGRTVKRIPYTEPKETLEQWLDRMPKPENYLDNKAEFHYNICKWQSEKP